MDFGTRPRMKKGVYLPSPNQDSAMMVRCLQVLLDTYRSMTFTSIKFDEKVHGYKIHFSKPDEAYVLRKNYLVVGNDHVWIYPLTTYLTVHGVIKNASPQFRNDLKNAIQNKFGKLLDVQIIDNEKPPPKINSSEFGKYLSHAYNDQTLDRPKLVDWRVQIDVPEFKGLEVFCEENFDLEISLPQWNEKLVITFWCRSCERNKHFQHECGSETGLRKHVVKGDIDKKKAGLIAQPSLTSDSPSEKPDETSEELPKTSQDPKCIQTCAESAGSEGEINCGNISEENLNLDQTNEASSSSSSSQKSMKDDGDDDDDDHSGLKIKKEKDEEKVEDVKSCPSGSNLDFGRECRVVIKREPCTSPIRTNEDSLNNSFLEPSPSSNDEDIQFVPVKRSPTHILPDDSNTEGNGRDEYCNSEDASMSPTNIKKEFSFPSFSDADTFSPSSSLTPAVAGPSRSRSKPVARVEVTSVLSDRLQECINSACDTCQVLDRKTLDAFLIHVKKKSNPVRVALNFTKNASDLKAQLKRILHLYYNTPQTGTKEDMQFIKWLNGLVDRFDGTIPRKRKRNDHSDEYPSKN